MNTNNFERSDDGSNLDRSIEGFLSNEMTETERLHFQELLAKDSHASELLSAEQMIRQYASQVSLEEAEMTSNKPSPFLMNYFTQAEPHRRWIGYVISGGFAIALAFLLYCTQRNNSGITPSGTAHAAIPVIDSLKYSVPQSTFSPLVSKDPSITSPSAITSRSDHSHTPVATQSQEQPAVPPSAKSHHFDEPLGAPRTFVNDSLTIGIHSK